MIPSEEKSYVFLGAEDHCKEYFYLMEGDTLNLSGLENSSMRQIFYNQDHPDRTLHDYIECLDSLDSLTSVEEENMIMIMSALPIEDKGDVELLWSILSREDLVAQLNSEDALLYFMNVVLHNYETIYLYSKTISGIAFDRIISMVDSVGNESLPEFYQNSFNDNREEIRAYYRKNADLGHVVYLERRYIVEQIEMFMVRGELKLKE